MILKIQIVSITFSFIYGMLFYFLVSINYKLLYTGTKIFKIISNLLFVMSNSLIYFLILLKINSGILHIYFILSLFTGYFLSKIVYQKLIVKMKKQ